MGKHDPGATMGYNVDDDRAQWEICARLIASVAAQVNAEELAVEVRNPQAFTGWIGIREAAGEEASDRYRTIQFQREFGTLISHSGSLSAAVAASHLNRVHVAHKIDRNGCNSPSCA